MCCKCNTAHPDGSLTGESLLGSGRTEDLMIRQFKRRLQRVFPTWDRASPGCWKLRRRGGRRLACHYFNNREMALVLERLKTQHSHSLGVCRMMRNGTPGGPHWRRAGTFALIALPRRGRTGFRPIPLLQPMRWIHWFESRPPAIARTTVRLLQPCR
jgi:hypothetical protein